MLLRQFGPKFVILLWPLLFLSACSFQPHYLRMGGDQIDQAFMRERLHDVTFPLLVATAEWCPFEQEPTYGFLLLNGEESRILGEGVARRGVIVSYVHPRSPASSAGLEPGDQLTEVNTQDVMGQA